MLETFDIGNVSIPSLYIAILLSFLVSYLMLWESEEKKGLFNDWLNAVIILFLIFKLTYIPFYWTAFINDPLGVLYFDGGPAGLLLGLLGMFGYLFLRSESLFYLEGYGVFAVSFLAFYGVLELRALTQWQYIALAVISLAALVAMYFMWRKFRVLLFISITLLVMHLVARFFIYSGAALLNISMLQWWIILSLVYLVTVTKKAMADE